MLSCRMAESTVEDFEWFCYFSYLPKFRAQGWWNLWLMFPLSMLHCYMQTFVNIVLLVFNKNMNVSQKCLQNTEDNQWLKNHPQNMKI